MSTKPMPVHGVDISHHQGGRLDMAGAKKRGLGWLYHKATEGESYVDDMYSRRRDEAKKAGLRFGAYHFARPDRGDAAREARHFLEVAKPEPGDLRAALDLETTEGMSQAQLQAWADTWCDIVAKATGAQPIIYTPFDLGGAHRNRYAWRPRYNNDNRPPVLQWDIWQFSNGVYGVPSHLEGIGAVDLNTMRSGLDVQDLLIPKPARDSLRVKVMHCSMQFNDSLAQKKHDAKAIFRRAKKRGVWWVTGTEAGAGSADLRKLLRRYARRYGYRFWMDPSTDAWYAVAKVRIAGNWETWSGPTVVPGKAHDHTAKKATSVSFDTHDIGRVTVMAGHYLTKGRPSAKTAEYRQHIDENKALADALADRAKVVGKGRDLVFYGGDQNIVDRVDDTFFGSPFVSTWDELEKWPNTGHGNIDVMASWSRDGRVSATGSRSLSDREFHLFTDHFAIEGSFEVKTIR